MSFVMPGAGQAYNGQWAKGGFVLGSTITAVALFGDDGLTCLLDDDGVNCSRAAAGLSLAGLVLIYSWVDAPLTAREINRRLHLGNATVEVGPRLLGSPGRVTGRRRAGLSLIRVKF